MIDTLSWLVDIPSETGSEAAIREAIVERLSGFPQTGTLNSFVVGEPGPDKVALVGHIDTVPPQGEAHARIEDDRLYGLGASDMKSGLAVMVHLLEDLGTDRIVGVFYAGEEGPLAGNELVPLLEAVPGLGEIRAGIVMEPTSLGIEAGCQGGMNARVWFEGEAAHSARPWLGENAVSKAGEFLTKMHRREPEVRVVEGLEFKEVVTVTRAHGGVANNVIPSRFEMNVNYRWSPDRTREEAMANLLAVCSDADGVDVVDVAPAAYPQANHELFIALAEAANAEISSKQGWTDVAQLAERGVPAVNFGPGEIALAHKPGESVRLADLDWAYDALSSVL